MKWKSAVKKLKGERTNGSTGEELRRCSGTQFDPDVVEVFIQCLSTANSCTAEEE